MRLLTILVLVLAAYFHSGPLLFAAGGAALLYAGSQLWLRHVVTSLRIERILESHLFFDQTATVELRIANLSALPVPWLELHESLPSALILPNVLTRVLLLDPHSTLELRYTLRGRRRGLHRIGPLRLAAGDVYGLARSEWLVPHIDTIVVYPRILSADRLSLPSLLLFGDLRSRRPFLGDPTRVSGIRPYSPGDPPHDIHWRATAATGELQTKQYQPSTSLQTCIFLDLRHDGYQAPDVLSVAELAISIAATIAYRLSEQRQEVGLVTNGSVPLLADDLAELIAAPDDGSASRATDSTEAAEVERRSAAAAPIPAAAGRGHLIRMLELLARVELGEDVAPLEQLLRRAFALPWGATIVLVAGILSDDLFLTLHRLRQCGLRIVVFTVEQPRLRAEYEERARILGITLQIVWQAEQFEAFAS